MAILEPHIPLYREIFAIPGVLAEPLLMIGFQDIRGHNLPEDFDYEHMKALLAARNVKAVSALDRFDERAELRYDLNEPLPAEEEERYATVIDLGTIEHVFDSRRCLESCLRLVRLGGHYVVTSPVKGYFGHGFHTFQPAFFRQALLQNGFDVLLQRFTADAGEAVARPEEADDVLIWMVGRKTEPTAVFEPPNQARWVP